MNQQFPKTHSLTVMQTTDILEFADSLNLNGLGIDHKLFFDPSLSLLRSSEILDLAAGLKIDSFSLADITNCRAA
jgi:hypothetical protein